MLLNVQAQMQRISTRPPRSRVHNVKRKDQGSHHLLVVVVLTVIQIQFHRDSNSISYIESFEYQRKFAGKNLFPKATLLLCLFPSFSLFVAIYV